MSEHSFSPESLMMSFGYKPELSEGAIKCPIFQTSTFAFKKAEDGKAFFEVAYGKREKSDEEELGLIYSRLNNPNLQITEDRLCLWDGAQDAAIFESGMGAISSMLMEFLNPGDVLLHSVPVYGGTDHFINHVLPKWGIQSVGVNPYQDKAEVMKELEASGMKDKVRFIYLETPANPTNALVDIGMFREIANELQKEEEPIYIGVDNTYMGPIWQHPLKLGADLVIYSATKYIGGHSDLVAGACLGSADLIKRVKGFRTFMGNMAGPHTGWLLMRSLETLKVRMEKQAANAEEVANFLNTHPKVEKVYYLGNLKPEDGRQYEIFKKQCSSNGAMLAFDIEGGEKEAFKFLNSTKLIKLAVSLGSTESLAEHPATMTHSDVNEELRNKINITSSLVRISVGVEDAKDLIWDIEQALEKV
ncbi:methionine gamma-lyase [Marivirga tractuosa]|uniref:Cys/Met metabolism pyridoxal-phosphate-dependent protein n=1 Tax=Marivirga tractuosa (strain ATCC 23168 / DSM 4126 / NBRC 15989 / NCIMB 1408 / VKM B-1430 / H-43) TaxID=643867 RepID=E4TVH9_MARTH|nr:cystathionine gamma-synthase family protein [Marivirga tractuosa]ADR20111.1 Cys/Met metabolism pyridoxal-phosphate-dependent protein [Marivirga tractuosa DSM 4126]BDD15451.1 methionine gamma-lyase [Marivirga tractuosa]